MEEWISSEEKRLVVQLRDRVINELPLEELEKSQEDQDAFLLRWLRARDLNLDKSQAMLINALKWRKDNDIDMALEVQLDPFFRKEYPYSFVGPDKGGHPVLIMPLHEWDFRKMLAANKADQFDQFMQYFFEDILKTLRDYNARRKPGHPPVTQFTAVCDISGYPYGQILSFGAMRKWLNLAAVYEAYYPEILYRVCAVNTPGYFQIFINMLKGVLAPRTLGKITCYNTKAAWQDDMETVIDPAILPVEYGGTLTINVTNGTSNGTNNTSH